MSIDRGDFDEISEQDLQELVTAQVPEGLRLEYKREAYGNSDADKREFLKDISALANSQGGHLILGIEEETGVAKTVTGIGAINSDTELLRLEQIARGGLEPRISGMRMQAIQLAKGNYAIVIRVPRSWNTPHRVVAQGSNRFYVRHSAGVHEPSVEELRMLFTQTTSALQQARQFRDERLEVIRSGVGNRPLVNEGRLILHIVPIASFSGTVGLDLQQVHNLHMAFSPLGINAMSPRFNYYGFINERGGDENHGYTQVFRNGILEATKAQITSERQQGGRRFLHGPALEGCVFEKLLQYINGLRDVGVPSPLIIMLSFEGVLDLTYFVGKDVLDGQGPPIPEDTLLLPECILEDYGEEVDHHRAVRPAFDALWNATGHAGSQFFNADGLWVGPQ